MTSWLLPAAIIVAAPVDVSVPSRCEMLSRVEYLTDQCVMNIAHAYAHPPTTVIPSEAEMAAIIATRCRTQWGSLDEVRQEFFRQNKQAILRRDPKFDPATADDRQWRTLVSNDVCWPVEKK